jgi:hypothetical protein
VVALSRARRLPASARSEASSAPPAAPGRQPPAGGRRRLRSISPTATPPTLALADGGCADTGLADGGCADTGLADGGCADTGLADGGCADTGLADRGEVVGWPADWVVVLGGGWRCVVAPFPGSGVGYEPAGTEKP